MGSRASDVDAKETQQPGTLSGNSHAVSLLLVALLLVSLGIGGYYVWRVYGDQILAQGGGRLTADSIHVSQPPEWIRSDVKSEAMLAGSLADLNIRQEDLTLRVAQAFSMHSWVAKVKRVSKRHPDRIFVEVVYRRPAAIVEYENDTFLVVDTEGVLLPSDNFTSDDAAKYPRISAADTAPVGPAGTLWGDARIHSGAQLAAALQRHWRKLGLYRIVAYRGQRDRTGRRIPHFELQTRQKTTILWGQAPGEELAGEPDTDHKVAHLLELVRQKGSLDNASPDGAIDLRTLRAANAGS
jgi:hypothetical protein